MQSDKHKKKLGPLRQSNQDLELEEADLRDKLPETILSPRQQLKLASLTIKKHGKLTERNSPVHRQTDKLLVTDS